MTDSFVTQCPHCQTSFRVTHHQLSMARGVVRCGQCLEVFNAARQLLEQSQSAAIQPPLAAPVSELPIAAQEQPPAAADDEAQAAPAEPAIVAPPVVALPATPTQADWEATTLALDALDLDQALASLERRDSPPRSDPQSARSPLQARRDDHPLDEQDDAPFGTASRGHGDDAQTPFIALPTLLEPQAAPPEASDPRTEPTLSLELTDDDDALPDAGMSAAEAPRLGTPTRITPDDDEPIALRGVTALDDTTPGERLSARDDDTLPATDDEPDERLEPTLGKRSQSAPRKEPLIDVQDDPLQLDWQRPAPNWGKRLLWGLLSLIALGGLGVQYVAYHFDELARQDQYRPLFQEMCPMFGCEVPTRVDIKRIKSSNLVVRSHPDFKGALIVDAIIYNRAPFSQPFPQLELRFADINGQLIASRRFKPSEYLSGELAGRGDMPSQTPIHIALDILDPGAKAVNYSLSFRSE